MQKLNELGVELQSLKQELLKPDYPKVVKKALLLSAENMAKNKIIDVNLHLSLTDEKIDVSTFNNLLLEQVNCLKTKEEMLVEFDKIRNHIQSLLDQKEQPVGIESKSLVETDQLAFNKTYKLDKQWVSEYFGQPADEVDKLMIRNGFVEKFAVLRLSKILEDFFASKHYQSSKLVDCKATRVFYDVEEGYYGIHLMFYVDIEEAEDEAKAMDMVEYMHQISTQATHYLEDHMKI